MLNNSFYSFVSKTFQAFGNKSPMQALYQAELRPEWPIYISRPYKMQEEIIAFCTSGY